MRLDKYLCDMNIGSRSQVKQYFRKGCVDVNGDIIKKPELHIDETKDIISVNGKTIAYKKNIYYMLNKPAGVVTAVKDSRDRTVMDLFDASISKGLFPVGRLDKDTEGLLLVMNDGELAHILTSPTKHIDKTYYAKINGRVKNEHIELFEEGLDIGEKKLTKPAVLNILKSDDISEIELTITEGKFHQVKRMFKAIGMEVIYLKRISMGKLKLDDTLMLGDYRELTAQEIAQIGGNV